MVAAYWEIGHAIVEEEQWGAERAEYGKRLVELLSERLRRDFGKGAVTESNPPIGRLAGIASEPDALPCLLAAYGGYAASTSPQAGSTSRPPGRAPNRVLRL